MTIDMIKMILIVQNEQSFLIWTSQYFAFELHKLKAPFLLFHLKSIQIHFETWVSRHVNMIFEFANLRQRNSRVDLSLQS
jgi:hypothetical protein